MKLVVGIVNNDDSYNVSDALTSNGFFVTKLASTGGFLKKGNVTFLVGTEEDKVEKCIEIIRTNAKKRVEKIPTVANEMNEFYTPVMVDVQVGGATIFVLPIEQFYKI